MSHPPSDQKRVLRPSRAAVIAAGACSLATVSLGGIALAVAACASGPPADGAPAHEAHAELRQLAGRPEVAQVGAEIGIATTGTTPAPYYRNSVSVASNGSGYLAVWDDQRDINGAELILGQLFSANGAPISAIPIVIARDGASRSSPSAATTASSASVSWDGKDYVVAWIPDTGTTVEAARVAPDGKLVDASPVTILKGLPFVNVGHVACGADGGCLFVAVYQASDGSTDLTATFATSLAPGAPVTVSSRAGSQDSPSIALDPSGFLVVFQDLAVGASAHDVYGQRLSAQGALVGANFAIATTADDEQGPVAANTGAANDAVAWLDQSADGSVSVVQSQLWPSTGATTTSPVVALTPDPTLSAVGVPATTLVGHELSVFFEVSDTAGVAEVARALVTQAGALDGTPVQIGGGLDLLQAATNGTGVLLVGALYTHDANQVRAKDVSGADASTDIVLTNAPPEQRDAVVASNQRDYLMTYAQYDSEKWATRAAILTPAGQVTVVGSLDPSEFRFAKAKADSAGNYLIATLTGNSVKPWVVNAYRVSDVPGQAPALGPAMPVRAEPVRAEGYYVWGLDLACGTTDCLVVWSEPQEAAGADAGADGGAPSFTVYGAVVANGGTDGGTVGTPVAISTASDVNTVPGVAFDGAKYIVGYERGTALYTRTFASGTVGPELTLATAAPGDTLVGWGTLACRGTDDCFAAWTESSQTTWFVNGVHVGPLGGAGAPFKIDPGTASNPSAIFDGVRYLVAWDRGGYTGPTANDVYLTEISADGASVVATNGVATTAADEIFGSVASASQGTAAVVYTRMVDDPSVLVPRVFARLVTNADDDGGIDAAPDASPDAGPDASPAASPDAGPDGASSDGGVDSGPAPSDAGPDAPFVGNGPDGSPGGGSSDASPPAADSGPPSSTGGGSSGCGCHVGAERRTSGSPFVVLLGLAALAAPRLRRRRLGPDGESP